MGNACSGTDVAGKDGPDCKWYFGVGTMINATRLANMGLTPIKSCPCEIQDHKHYFYDKPGMAEAVPCKGESFHGVMHRMTPEQIGMLDKMMAGHYTRQNAKAKLYDGSMCDVVHYVRGADVARNSDVDGDPDARFMAIMIEGAKHYKCKPEFVKYLESYPCIPRPNPSDYCKFPEPPEGSECLTKEKIEQCKGENGKPLLIAINGKVCESVCKPGDDEWKIQIEFVAKMGQFSELSLAKMLYDPKFGSPKCIEDVTKEHAEYLEDVLYKRMQTQGKLDFWRVCASWKQPYKC